MGNLLAVVVHAANIHDTKSGFLEELDRPTLLRLVKRIEVGERRTVNGHDERDIKIYYSFVGFVEL